MVKTNEKLDAMMRITAMARQRCRFQFLLARQSLGLTMADGGPGFAMSSNLGGRVIYYIPFVFCITNMS